MSFNLALAFHERALVDPKRIALRVEGADITYGELSGRASQVAIGLRDAVRKDKARVGIYASRTVEAYAGLLGTCLAGYTYVPLSPDQPEDRVASIVRRAGLDAVIADRPLPAGVRECAPRADLALDHMPPMLDGWPVAEPVRVDRAAIAYIMFTSGSTGTPKGVQVTAGNVAHFLRAMRERCPISPDDRVSQWFDLTFDLSVHDVFMTLATGAALHVVPKDQRMAPARFLQDERLTVWFSVPSVVAILRKLGLLTPGRFPSLRLSLFCGEPLPVASVEAWRAAAPASVIENQYGPTEATVSCTAERWSDTAPRVTQSRDTVSIGKPYPGMQAAILGQDRKFLPAGEVGELVLSGPQVAAGYLDDPELTGRRFPTLRHPQHGEAIWYLTGDLAYEDGDGSFHHLGRIDNQVKVLGRRVELEDIEAHLRAVCETDAVAAVAWPIEHGSADGIVAFVASPVPAADVQRAMKARVPAFMVPRAVMHVAEIPLTPNGKLDRKKLVAILEDAKR